MTKLSVWIVSVLLTQGGPVVRYEVKDCSALHDWVINALAWRERSGLHTNVVATCIWQEKKS